MTFKNLEEFENYLKSQVDIILDDDTTQPLDMFYLDELGELANEILDKEDTFEYRGYFLNIMENGDNDDYLYLEKEVVNDEYPLEKTESFDVKFDDGSKTTISIDGTQKEIDDFCTNLINQPNCINIKHIDNEVEFSYNEQNIIDQIKNIIEFHLLEGKEFNSYWTVPSYGNTELITNLLKFEYKGYCLMPLDDPDKSIKELTYLTFRIEKED